MKYTIETEINAPRSRVVELFNNPDNLACWQPGFVSFTHESGEPGQPGAVSRIRYRHGDGKGKGREFEMIETVTTCNPPEEFSGRFEVPGMFTVEIRNRFRELDSDRTLLISENDMRFHGWMMKLMSVFIAPCSKRESRAYMDHFKAFVETGADVRRTGGA